jgi:hypothetical protein
MVPRLTLAVRRCATGADELQAGRYRAAACTSLVRRFLHEVLGIITSIFDQTSTQLIVRWNLFHCPLPIIKEILCDKHFQKITKPLGSQPLFLP